jgi:hypothetical protein
VVAAGALVGVCSAKAVVGFPAAGLAVVGLGLGFDVGFSVGLGVAETGFFVGFASCSNVSPLATEIEN